MFCRKCGFKNDDDAVFCGRCGERMEEEEQKKVEKKKKENR